MFQHLIRNLSPMIAKMLDGATEIDGVPVNDGTDHQVEEARNAWLSKERSRISPPGTREPSDAKVYAALSRSQTVFYTPTVGGTLRELRDELDLLKSRTTICIDQHIHRSAGCRIANYVELSELLVIDEAERLSPTALEYIRDMHDRIDIGVILIGMPGIEKSLSRYLQLYSRVGFAHHYRPLKDAELSFVLTQRWRQLGLALDVSDFTDTQAIASIVRATGGNFRLLHRLFVQIERVLKINELRVITDDVVEAARSTLVIGAN